MAIGKRVRHELVDMAEAKRALDIERFDRERAPDKSIASAKAAEQPARASERTYRLLFENNPQPMWIYDMETLGFMEVNDAAIAHYGYSREQWLSMTIYDIRPPEDAPAVLEKVADRNPLARSGPWRHIKADGSVIEVEITSHVVAWESYRGRFVMAEDVTQRERLQRQLLQSQRMESLGELAGGVAHDFNNLLGVILNYAYFVREQVSNAAREDAARWLPVADDVQQIELAGKRASRLTHQLLSFARREVTHPDVLNLNEVIGEVEELLRRSLGEHIELITSGSPDLCPVLADSGRLEQVLLNLAVNARDAMPSGGTLSIETENITLDEIHAANRAGLSPGRYVQLRVSDTGSGMPRETSERAFEPFFTTKPKGKGTGFGLAIIYGIITQAGGSAQIYSEPGIGTTFTALLPATDKRRHAPHSDSELYSLGGQESVLLVEGEAAMREVTRRILSRNGYWVISAGSGAEAIELAGKHEGRLDLLITDVVTPQMPGREVAVRLSEMSPGIRVLYMSGQAVPIHGSPGTLDPGCDLVEKPFSESALLTRVRATLAGAPSVGEE